MSTGFCTPAGPGRSELTEKRSRFIGQVRPVDNEQEAKDFIMDETIAVAIETADGLDEFDINGHKTGVDVERI